MNMNEQWAMEHIGMTPAAGGCGTSYHDERGDVQDCTSVEPCRACLRRRIEQLEAQRGGAQRGGSVVVPEYPENSFDVRMAVQKAGGMADFDQGIFRAGWEFLASRIQPIPADRVLADGEISMSRAEISAAFKAGFAFSKDWRNHPSNSEYVNELFRLRSAKGEVNG